MTQSPSGGFSRLRIPMSARARTAARWLATGLMAGFLLLAAAVLIVAARLPSLAQLDHPKGPGAATVQLAALPAYVPKAFIVTEDRWFYWHPGFNPWGIARSQVYNLRHHSDGVPLRGGSTITQQVARNLFLSRDQTFGRKAQELVLALALEVRYSKRDILALYLDQTDFGGGAIGLQAASQTYFGRPATRLTVSQAALLAGVLKGTDRYSPLTHPDRAQQRADLIVDNMARRGVITPAQQGEALASLARLGTTQLALATQPARTPAKARAVPVKLSAKAAAPSKLSWRRVRSAASAAKRRTLAKAREFLPGRQSLVRATWREWTTQWSGMATGTGRGAPGRSARARREI
ncbi:MAG: penicillin-binding protein [Caulobacteraceae bacterium]|nr:penicillin-binding protein [Caulobacteraceae bacterium]